VRAFVQRELERRDREREQQRIHAHLGIGITGEPHIRRATVVW
jgi:hypothetical protein